MPDTFPELGEWLSPGIIAAAGPLLINQLVTQIGKQIDSLEATTNRRFDELQKNQDRRFDEFQRKPWEIPEWGNSIIREPSYHKASQ